MRYPRVMLWSRSSCAYLPCRQQPPKSKNPLSPLLPPHRHTFLLMSFSSNTYSYQGVGAPRLRLTKPAAPLAFSATYAPASITTLCAERSKSDISLTFPRRKTNTVQTGNHHDRRAQAAKRLTRNIPMVTIERRVHRLLRYRKFWFPNRDQAREISRSLRPNDVVRFFAAPTDLAPLPHLVEHYRMQTSRLDLSAGPEALLNGMKRKSCRYEIHRAEKMLHQTAIEIATERSNRDFLALYNEFTRAKGLPPLHSGWIPQNAAYTETLVLYLDGKPLCAHLFLRDPQAQIVRLLYSCSRRLESSEDASACGSLNRYLHWYEMQRYHALGFAIFDFGGLGHPESIARFKLSFGGSVLTEHYYLLSGVPSVAKLGKLLYEQILRRRTFQPHPLDLNAPPPPIPSPATPSTTRYTAVTLPSSAQTAPTPATEPHR
jgi:hypothetical protein